MSLIFADLPGRKARSTARAFPPRLSAARASSHSQRGVVLMIALIVLVAMTLAATTLFRSVDTTNLIAGNLALHESAVFAGDRGVESAIVRWLSQHSAEGDGALFENSTANAYFAVRADPNPGESWDAFWMRAFKDVAVKEAAEDAAGNTVSHVIHRLCDATGSPRAITCFKANIRLDGSSSVAGQISVEPKEPVYYRVTSRVVGPRNAVAYVQTILAL